MFSLIVFAVFNCETDNEQVKEPIIESTNTQITPTVKTVSYDEVGEKFNNLKNEFKLQQHLDDKLQSDLLSRTTTDTLGLTIYTDVIKEITLDDYTSYTMRIATVNVDSTKFYNLTIEDKNGTAGMFITKYTPTPYWLDNKSEPYEGEIATQRTNDLTTVGEDDSGISEGELSGVGGGSSSEYPWECEGYVITTYVLVAHRCQCVTPGHLPDQCVGPCDSPGYYTYEPRYECVESSDYDWSQTGNGSYTGGGLDGTDSTGSNTISITTLIGSDGECVSPSIDALNEIYSQHSPFNVDLSDVRVTCENIDTNEVEDNEKFMCIYNKLAASPSFKNLFIDTFGESSQANIKFELVDLPVGVAGKNIADVGNIQNQTIQINKNHLTSKHPLTNAQTIIHEAIHAYLKIKAYECSTGTTVEGLNNQELDELLSFFDYSCLSTAVNEYDLMLNIIIPYMQQLLLDILPELVAPEDLNPIINFYPRPDEQLHEFDWTIGTYYMSFVGLGNAQCFQDDIMDDGENEDLFNDYNSYINNSNTFNHSTCEN